MIHLLIGHRGVGKTSLLKRITGYFVQVNRKASCIDLDQEVVSKAEKSIAEIFEEVGESEFRKLESSVLNELVETYRAKSEEVFIALGAGFEGAWPKGCRVIWVQRETDGDGRIFLNRPRLEKNMTALDEFFRRKKIRDERFESVYDIKLILREGVDSQDQGEFQFFTGQFERHSGFLTCQQEFSEEVLSLPFSRLEIRDDISLPPELYKTEASRLLLSRRKKNSLLQKKVSEQILDQALEVMDGDSIEREVNIVSVHDFLEGESLPAMLDRIERLGRDKILKVAPVVDDFSDLLLGYQWQQRDPSRRVFLPRSACGRWCWFRLFMKDKMPLNFWRLDQGSAFDQPTFLEWLNEPEKKNGFAAILGAPVRHSRTPTEQESFFRDWHLPVYRIEVSESEWSGAIEVLKKLGLVAAAVTSPLKHSAYLTATVKSMEAERLQSVNTLFFSRSNEQVHGHNTDGTGFKNSMKDLTLTEPVAIWGGGGTLSMLLGEFENAVTFSARTGRPRVMRDLSSFSPKTVIWASGRDSSYKWPLHDWDPEIVVDLSYADNSMGLEYAQLLNCKYRSGARMFKEQAKEQRRFWKPLLENEYDS